MLGFSIGAFENSIGAFENSIGAFENSIGALDWVIGACKNEDLLFKNCLAACLEVFGYIQKSSKLMNA